MVIDSFTNCLRFKLDFALPSLRDHYLCVWWLVFEAKKNKWSVVLNEIDIDKQTTLLLFSLLPPSRLGFW